MNRDAKLLGITTVVMICVMALSGTAFAGTPTNTNWLQAGSFDRGSIEGAVGVCEQDQQRCGTIDGTMKVKLFKRVDGVWVKIAVKQATKESDSLWSVKFTGTPRAGKCKMLALYSGSENFDPSRDAVRGGCAEPSWPL